MQRRWVRIDPVAGSLLTAADGTAIVTLSSLGASTGAGTLKATATVGYGVALVEAMVMGKPIVATDIAGSGVPWVNVHGRTGLNVPVRDPGALADALHALLSDVALRRRMSAASRRRYEEEFRAERMTGRVLDLYRALVGALKLDGAGAVGHDRPRHYQSGEA